MTKETCNLTHGNNPQKTRSNVFRIIRMLKPSGCGELEITDVNNYYIDKGSMGYRVLDGCLPRCGDVWEFALGGVMVEKIKQSDEA